MIIGEPFLDIDSQRWDNLMSVNVRGPYLCCRYVLPVMIEQRSGSVVNIGSGMGVSYCAAAALPTAPAKPPST